MKKMKDVRGRKLMTKKFLQKEIPISTWKLNQRMIAGRSEGMVGRERWRSRSSGSMAFRGKRLA